MRSSKLANRQGALINAMAALCVVFLAALAAERAVGANIILAADTSSQSSATQGSSYGEAENSAKEEEESFDSSKRTGADETADTGESATEQSTESALGDDPAAGATLGQGTGGQDTGTVNTGQSMVEEPAADTRDLSGEATAIGETNGDTGTAGMVADDQQPATSTGVFVPVQREDQLLTMDLIGKGVTNAAEEEIGKVSGFVFDSQGSISAVMIGVGGFLGLGQKQVAVDWTEMTIQPGAAPGEEMVMIDRDREELENAPEYKMLKDIMNERIAEQLQQEAQQQMQSQQPTVPSDQ